jgi:hypothetical protein
MEPELQKRRTGAATAEEGAGEVEEYWNHKKGLPLLGASASGRLFLLLEPGP